jgi:(+)-pinoresinol hydroxylase
MRALLVLLLTLSAAPFALAADPANGERLYGNWCIGCHDRLGPTRPTMPGTTALAERYKGARPPALVDRDDLTPEFVKLIVRRGVSFMPFFRKTELTDAELDDVAAFLSRPRAR